MKLTNEQRKAYLQGEGASCPYCGVTDIEGQSVDIDTCHATQEVRCLECGEEWLDIYTLTDVEAIQ